MNYEHTIARVLLAADPRAALKEAIAHEPRLRTQLLAIDIDGLCMSALLIAKLRFERLLRGSRSASAWFSRDEQHFTACFRRYHATVLPTAFSPPAEAACFARFLAEHAVHPDLD